MNSSTGAAEMSREYDSKIVSDNTEGFVFRKQKPNYTMTFSHEGKSVGELDWNNHPATFTGDMDASARVFFDYLIQVWPSLLDEAVQKAMPVVSAGQPGWQLREVYFDEDLMPTAYRAPQHSGMVSVPIEIINRFPELDMDDYYSHADVCALNEWGVELVLAAQEQQ
jgi:hypothetical protein